MPTQGKLSTTVHGIVVKKSGIIESSGAASIELETYIGWRFWAYKPTTDQSQRDFRRASSPMCTYTASYPSLLRSTERCRLHHPTISTNISAHLLQAKPDDTQS